jgi:peptidoglycan-associated lipoprotein
VSRKGLTDEAKSILAAQAEILKKNADWGLLVQGYTDQQGSASYNKKLGLRRADTVKAELMSAGVAENQIKIVSLGEEGVLCIDKSDVCRNINRRVHLEMRKIGQEHMIAPAVATQPKTIEPIQSADGPNGYTDGDGIPTDNLLPSFAGPSGTDPSPLTTDLASGS